ncbi:hypothetical protein GKZ68_21005 (plasmid) [Hymenobacter sp. BRD128]|uniref:hypothetical protein n=1 Tax=Hymenobacter sp. BRD128 TaxID=2675878 RepID=UPI001564ECA6|nr:hypothetical protein [Hymenobacter sp. BRD128]QKG59162.1 hypothetical protein GKZ68_21005 [Hymenobacter sp. BRD128]
MTITRMTAGSLLDGLLAIFSLTATATPAEGNAVQEVGVNVATPLGPEQLRQLLMLSEITRTSFTLQAVASHIRVAYSAPPSAPAAPAPGRTPS